MGWSCLYHTLWFWIKFFFLHWLLYYLPIAEEDKRGIQAFHKSISVKVKHKV